MEIWDSYCGGGDVWSPGKSCSLIFGVLLVILMGQCFTLTRSKPSQLMMEVIYCMSRSTTSLEWNGLKVLSCHWPCKDTARCEHNVNNNSSCSWWWWWRCQFYDNDDWSVQRWAVSKQRKLQFFMYLMVVMKTICIVPLSMQGIKRKQRMTRQICDHDGE